MDWPVMKKPIVITYSLWILLESLIVIGVLLYGGMRIMPKGLNISSAPKEEHGARYDQRVVSLWGVKFLFLNA